jgi:hypothetical protein
MDRAAKSLLVLQHLTFGVGLAVPRNIRMVRTGLGMK